MTVSTKAIKVSVDTREVKALLEKMPRRMSESIRKKAMRAALLPAQKELRRIWAAAAFRGKRPHRKAIVSATQIDVRRHGSGDLATIQGAVGVRYGRKGGARAAGRQKVWHLLEHGFFRHSVTSAYRGLSSNLREDAESRRAFVKSKRDEIFAKHKGTSFKAKKARNAEMREVFAEARERWTALSAFRKAKAESLEQARSAGAGSRVPGRKISTRWVASHIDEVMQRIRDAVIREARKALA
jgi:hypothetical protein